MILPRSASGESGKNINIRKTINNIVNYVDDLDDEERHDTPLGLLIFTWSSHDRLSGKLANNINIRKNY